MKFFFIFLTIFSFISSDLCFASIADKSKCSLISEIIISKSKTTLLGKLDSAGTILSHPRELESIRDGEYVFLVDNKKNIVVSKRFPNTGLDPNSNKLFAAHLSLESRLKRKFNSNDIDVVSSGKFRVLFGNIVYLSNQSGTFRGGASSLQNGVDFLKNFGLNIKEETRLIDFSRDKHESNEAYELIYISSDGHSGSLRRSRAILAVHMDKNLLDLTKRSSFLYRKILKLYPHEYFKTLADDSYIYLEGIPVDRGSREIIRDFIKKINSGDFEFAVYMQREHFSSHKYLKSRYGSFTSYMNHFLEEIRLSLVL